MHAFQNDWMFIFFQVFNKFRRGKGGHDVRNSCRESFVSCIPVIIIYFNAVLLQLRLLFPAIFKTVQVYFYAELMQCSDFPEKVKHPSVINRVGYVETDNMQVFVQLMKFIKMITRCSWQ